MLTSFKIIQVQIQNVDQKVFLTINTPDIQYYYRKLLFKDSPCKYLPTVPLPRATW